MTFFQVATYSFAVIGVASLAKLLIQWLRGRSGEDGPIRVKGGSVIIENDDYDWEKDDGDGKKEYHFKGRPNRWKVTVWKNGGLTQINGIEARRVRVLTIDSSGNDGTVVFRPNGAVRVLDEEGRFVASGKTLTDNSAGARISRVVVRRVTGQPMEEQFGSGDEAKVELLPLA